MPLSKLKANVGQDSPWMVSMSPSTKLSESGSIASSGDTNPPTAAAFSPVQGTFSKQQRKTVLVHQKTPLLLATPPQITRALAFSHPFLLPINKFMGLITWSSGDPWESFLLVASFWAVVLFGDNIITTAGPLLGVMGLMAGMYGRRYSPLSTTATTGEKVKGSKKDSSEGSMRYQKSLDEIIDTLNIFTSRCNILVEPLLELTDFLSTQQSATSTTTRPALTTLFIRILMVLPIWIALALSPLRVITSQRVVLVVGTLFLTWHSRPARISRTILWRSLTVRKVVAVITGLSFTTTPSNQNVTQDTQGKQSQQAAASSLAVTGKTRGGSVRFTFTVYENQRRWLGLGWTSSMFAYERAAWTDEHLNPAPSKDKFQLPDIDSENTQWRWVPGSEWRTEGSSTGVDPTSGKPKNEGWIFYDNKWNDGRRQDGWGRYTRRRKWFRDAELVEKRSDGATDGPSELPAVEAKGSISSIATSSVTANSVAESSTTTAKDSDDTDSPNARRRGFFGRGSRKAPSAKGSNASNQTGTASEDDSERKSLDERAEHEKDWTVADDTKMGLG